MTLSTDERLFSAEKELLEALIYGDQALSTFHEHYLGLLHDLEKLPKGDADEDTMIRRGTASRRLPILTEHLLEFQTISEEMTSQFEDELDKIFSNLVLKDTHAGHASDSDSSCQDACPDSDSRSTPLYSSNKRSTPAYLVSAFDWLRRNLHNPYPSRETKTRISYETCTEVKDVDSWFIEMRRRIGWNKIRKQHFGNRRVDILDAAAHYFLKKDECPLKQDVRQAFVRMELLVNDMYKERYAESKLASKFDNFVKEMTPDLKVEAERQRRQCQTISSRKRRLSLSDSDCSSHPKRPRNHSLAPRPCPVSDTIPISQPSAFDYFPLSVSTDNVEPTSLFDVRLGDLSQFCPPSSPSTQSAQSTPPLALLPSLLLEPSALSDKALHFAIDQFNNSIWNMSVQQVPTEPFLYDPLELSFDVSKNTAYTAVTDYSSQFTSDNPASNTDWSSQPFVFSPSGAGPLDELQGVGLPTFPNTASNSVLTEESLSDESTQILTPANRAWKQWALMEAREFTRMLEC